MRIGRGLVLVAGAACVVLLAAASVRSWDVSGLAPRIERAFELATGRAVRIGGPVRFRLLPSPSLLASEVSVANLPGGSRPAMLTAASVRASLDIGALLERRIEVESLSLSGPHALLETVRGVPNWVFHPRHETGSVGPVRAPGGARPEWRLDALTVVDGRLAWRGTAIGSGEIALGRVLAHRDGRGLTLVADARHGAMDAHLSLAAGAPGARDGVPVRATIDLGRSGAAGRIGLDGDVAFDRRAFDGRVHARIAQLAALNALFPHAGLPRAEGVHGDARVGLASGRWFVGALSVAGGKADPGRWVHGLTLDRFSLGAADASKDLAVDAVGTEAGKPVALRGTVGSPGFWLQPTGQAPLAATLSVGRDRLAVAGTMQRTGTRSGALHGHLSLRAPDPAPLASAGFGLGPGFDADGPVSVTGRPGALSASLAGRIGVGGEDFGSQTVSVSLQGRALAVQVATMGATWASWSEDLASHDVRLALHGHGLPAGPVVALIGGPGGIDGSLALDATLDRASAGWSGPFDATLTDGTIDPALARSLIAPVLQAARLPAISGPVALRCASASGSLDGPSLVVRTFSLASAALDGQGQGMIGLAPPGRLDLQVRPSLRLGPTYVSTSLSVGGSFASPRFALAPVNGRFGLRIGPPMAGGACAGVGATEGGHARHKLPNAAALLRGLGLK